MNRTPFENGRIWRKLIVDRSFNISFPKNEAIELTRYLI